MKQLTNGSETLISVDRKKQWGKLYMDFRMLLQLVLSGKKGYVQLIPETVGLWSLIINFLYFRGTLANDWS